MIKVKEVNVSWGSRQATLKECAETFLVFMKKLKQFDPRFSIWYEGGNSKKDASQNIVQYEYEYIKKMFCNKCDETYYPEMNFIIGMWNGASTDGESTGLRGSIGGIEEKLWKNTCGITLPYEGELSDFYDIPENYNQLQNLFIEFWNPDKILNEEGKWIEIKTNK